VAGLAAGDAGKYRCRVDFTVSPTFNSWVKLKVIVPPKPPVIENERGKVLSSAAAAGGGTVVAVAETDPVAEGGSLRLHCLTAGDPVPTVTWRYRGIPLQPVSLHSDANSGQVRSTVTLDDIRRHVAVAGGGDDNNPANGGGAVSNGQQLVECTAHNNDLTPPSTVSVKLRVISPPLRVKIVRELTNFAVGEAYNLTCQVLGSSPAPQVSFLIGGRTGAGQRRLLPLSWSQESPDGSVFSAVGRYEPLASDNGELLACRAGNRLLPDTTLEDQWRLDIHCEYRFITIIWLLIYYITVLYHCVVSLYSITVFYHCIVSLYFITVLDDYVVSLSCITVLYHFIVSLYCFNVLCHCTVSLHCITVLYHCIVSLYCITVLYHCTVSLY
jgi:hypothetical protein